MAPYIKSQKKVDGNKKVPWLVSALIFQKDMSEFIEHFKNNEIDIRSFFFALTTMDIYKKYAFGENKTSKKLSKLGISFPTHSNIDFDHIREVFEAI